MVSEAQSLGLGSSDGSVQSRNVRSASREKGFLTGGSTLVGGFMEKSTTSRKSERDAFGLSDAERRELSELRRRDLQVRTDEKPKFSEAQGLTQGVPKYSLVKGPDGKMYAVGGQVDLDTSPEKSPEETIEKAQRIRAVAMTAFDLSPEDIRFVARASMMEMEARGEIQMEMMEKASKIGEVKSAEWTDSVDDDSPISDVIEAVKEQRETTGVSPDGSGTLDRLLSSSGLSITPAEQAVASQAYVGRYQFREPTFYDVA